MLLLSSVVFSVAGAEAQLTTNVLFRVLHIQAGSAVGTGFTLDVDGRQYLITAKHLVALLKDRATVKIFKDGKWSAIAVTVFRCADPVDIAVLIPPFQLTVSLQLEIAKATPLGQAAYFLGFPYGKFFSDPKGLSSSFPVPFIKGGVISAVMQESGGATVFYLDGHNNPGFSGGPVLYRDSKDGSIFRVLAVISGYEPDFAPVFDLEEIKRGAITPDDKAQGRIAERSDGKVFRLKETTSVIRSNAGIVKSYSIKHALDLIEQNPIGPKIAN